MKKQLLISIFSVIFCLKMFSQGAPACPSITPTATPAAICQGSCTNLNATVVSNNQTTSYSVAAIAYSPYAFTGGTGVSVGTDDVWSPVMNLGFAFCYFGTPYTQAVVGSNGQLTFDLTKASGYDSYPVTSAFPSTANMPGNTISAVFRDIDPSVGGSCNYYTTGTAPCRALVINWYDIPLFLCGTPHSTFQLVLYENTNYIDIYIQNSDGNCSWESGHGIVGIQNAAATVAVCAPGENNTAFTATNEGWRFSPTGAPSYNVTWTNPSNVVVGTGLGPINVCPTTNTTYTSTMVITDCNAATTTYSNTVSVVVNSAPTVTVNTPAPICVGQSVTLNATPSTGGGTYSWAPGGQTTASITVNPAVATTYTVTYTLAGCSATGTGTVTINPPPTVTVPGNINICPGATVAATAFVSTPAGATYTWTNSNTAIGLAASGIGNVPSFTATNAGVGAISGTITVTPTLGCLGTPSTYTITVNPNPASTYTQTANQCLSGNSFNFTNTGNSGAGFSQTWNFGGAISNTSAAVSPTGVVYSSAGTFTITHIVTNTVTGCSSTTTSTVTVYAAPTALAVTTVNAACLGSNGVINIGAVTGGTGAYTYSVNGSPYTGTLSYSGFASGTYTVIVKDANGCIFTTSALVNSASGPTALAVTPVNATCGASNGTINIGAVTGGTGAYTYSVNASPYTPTTSYTGFAAGTYTVSVKDFNGCTFSTTVSISNLSGLLATETHVNVSCNGGSDGSITITASGSSAPYSYSNNGGTTFQLSGTFSGLTQGTYSFIAKDGNGCTVIVPPITITQPTLLTGTLTSQININCFGGTGSATVSAAGGTTAYSYSIDGGTYGASATFAGLVAGVHTVTIKDAKNCTTTVAVTITQPAALTLTTSSTNASCTAANGTATVAVSGGTTNYAYLWTPGAAITPAINNITAGNYSVLVTDAHGCTQTANISVGANAGASATISSSANVSCVGAIDGTATVSMGAGSIPPFTYAWNPAPGGGQGTPTATGLSPASYNITVTDGYGCVGTASVIITQPTQLTVSFTTTAVSCFGGSNGTATINPTGATPGYTFLWTPGGYTTQTITNLSAGTYICVCTDIKGCSKTATTTITQPTGMVLSSTHIDANCSQANGSATVSITGGTGPYTYLWNNPGVQTTITATGLASNTYVVKVTDANACFQTLPVTINNLSGPVASIFGSNNASCFGNNDGSATAVVTGGNNPYQFSWSNGQTLPTATNLVAGTYTLTATDMSGCIATTSIAISEPTPLSTTYSFTNPTCFGQTNGTATTATTGGTPPYTYLWTPGGATTSSLTGLAAGSYFVTVKDAHSCTSTSTVILSNPTQVAATTLSSNVTCSGLCNGSATANPTSGNGPFTYSWNDPNGQHTALASGLCGGSYTVTVTAVDGCSSTAIAIVTNPNPMSVNITALGNVSCFSACDGFAQATVVGGTAPYSYLWMPGNTAGGSVNNLCAATYTITVIDANGCSVATTATITQPVALTASIVSTNVTCYNSCDGGATAVYQGGTGPYTFQWTPSLLTTPTIASICAGVQNLTVSDGKGCSAIASVVITEPTILAVSTTTTNSNCGSANGSACAQITGGSPPFIYSWNDPMTQAVSCANAINAGVYTISITDSHGCSATNVANVNDNSAPIVTIPTSANVTCHGAGNGSAQAVITGGIVPYLISWTPGNQATAYVNNLSGGIHSIIVTDSVGCIGTNSVTINEPATLVSGIIGSTDVTCSLSCDGSATVTAGGGTTPYTYLWNDAVSQTTTTAVGLCAQQYNVNVTDANGCTSSSVATIGQPSSINIQLVSVTNVTCFGGNNGQITTSVTGGTPGYTYTWTPNVGSSAQITNLVAGSYQLMVKDANGCTKTLMVNIQQPNAIIITTNVVSSTCSLANGGASVTVLGGITPYTYFWQPTGTPSPVINMVAAGTYSVTVTDNHGCTADTSVTIQNIVGPTISNMTFTEPTCNGTSLGTATVVATGGQPLYTYLWSGIGAQTTQTATALPIGTYQVTVSDANHCNVIGIVTITEPAPLVVVPSPKDTICIGQLAQIYGAGYGGTPLYTYTYTPAMTPPGPPYTVSPMITTTYTVYAKDAHNCISAPQTISIYVRDSVRATATDTAVCNGNSVPISATATGGTGGPYTYSWSNGSNTQSQTVSPTINQSPSNYIVTVSDGCSPVAHDISTVTVYPLAVSFMSVIDTAGCEDFTVHFSALSNIGVSFLWNFGDGSAPQAGVAVTHTYVNPNSYNVSLTVTTAQGCVSTVTNNQYIDVYPKPTAAFSSIPNQATSTVPLISFTDQSIGATTWSWDFGVPYFGHDTSTTQNPIYVYSDTGSYNVKLIVTNNYGCADTIIHPVSIIPEYVIYAPNAFTPFNHDGLNDYFMPKGVGIDPKNFEMLIFDRWGILIFKTNDINLGWDGKANGGSKIAQADTYVWKIVTKDYKGDNHQYIGHVSLVR